MLDLSLALTGVLREASYISAIGTGHGTRAFPTVRSSLSCIGVGRVTMVATAATITPTTGTAATAINTQRAGMTIVTYVA